MDLLYSMAANLSHGGMPSDEMRARWTQAVTFHLGARQMQSFK